MTDLEGFRDHRETIAELHPKHLRAYDAALGAFAALLDGGPWEDDNPLVQAAKSKHVPLIESGTEMLGVLTGQRSEACEAVRAMLKARGWQGRFNAVLCLRAESPDDLIEDVLGAALGDKSAKVRRKVADWVIRLACKGSVPAGVLTAIEARVEAEEDEDVQASLRECVHLARDGHYLTEPDEEGERELTVLLANGTSTSWYDQDELEERGLEALVKELRDEG